MDCPITRQMTESRCRHNQKAAIAFWGSAEKASKMEKCPCEKVTGKQSVAQPGSAPALGAGGRVFKSRRSDQKNSTRRTKNTVKREPGTEAKISGAKKMCAAGTPADSPGRATGQDAPRPTYYSRPAGQPSKRLCPNCEFPVTSNSRHCYPCQSAVSKWKDDPQKLKSELADIKQRRGFGLIKKGLKRTAGLLDAHGHLMTRTGWRA